ncbi:MAG: nuclear transport factor 2 family protein [Bacteroidetes bacterium]|nr:MAG: nuclear transport factor 2 family protein [Bacteroidota bacterium]
MRIPYWLTLVLMLSIAAGACAQQAAVLAAEQARFTAQIEEDVDALAELLHEDLYYLHSNGLAESKADFIASVRTGKIDYQRMTPQDQQFRRYGRTAILTGLVSVDGSYQGTVFSLGLYYTSVYLRRRGQWQLVSWQSTAKRE